MKKNTFIVYATYFTDGNSNPVTVPVEFVTISKFPTKTECTAFAVSEFIKGIPSTRGKILDVKVGYPTKRPVEWESITPIKPSEFQFQSVTLGKEQLLDTFSDALTIIKVIEKQLEDGWQFSSDLLAILLQQDKFREIFNDFPLFVDSFKSLNEKDALEVADKLKEDFKDSGKITTFILDLLYAAAKSYHNGVETFDLWKNLFS